MTPMNILIITGGSKGIGKALASYYSEQNYRVFSLARTHNNSANYTQINTDLTQLPLATKALESIFLQLDSKNISSISLINNAGKLGKIGAIENLEPNDILSSIQLNTITPLSLSSLFIKHTKGWTACKQIINISSGAAKNPYTGWSVYCSSKAAIDMMTKVIAAEQSQITNGVHCIAIYPGVVDTGMQTKIRATDEVDFSTVKRFKDLKANNALYNPNFVAEKIFKIATEKSLENGTVLDIRTI